MQSAWLNHSTPQACKTLSYRLDQIYWQIISLVNKKKLAENFLELVQKLDSDVDKMIKEGVATKADGFSVKVKVNEAEMMLTQVEMALNLSKMLLCQLCGLPLETDFQLADESMRDSPLPNTYTEANVSTALSNREELKSLELASEIYRQKSKRSPRGLPSFCGIHRQLSGDQPIARQRI